MSSNNIAGKEFFNTYLQMTPKYFVESVCYEKVKNCALCGGFDSSKCKMCIDNHMLVNSTRGDGSVEEVCMKDFCPTGYKKFKKMNGIAYCEPCEIENCSECTQVKFEKTFEICIKCDGQFQLSHTKRRCVDIVDDANFHG